VNLVWNLGVSWIRVKQISNIFSQISEKFRFFQAILQSKLDFSRQISRKFWFFSGNFTKNRFFRQKFPNDPFSVHPDKIDHLQLLLAKLFYFSSKVTTFEHKLLPAHDKIRIGLIFLDPSTTPTTPLRSSPVQNLGVVTPPTSQDWRLRLVELYSFINPVWSLLNLSLTMSSFSLDQAAPRSRNLLKEPFINI